MRKKTPQLYPYTLHHVVQEVNTFYFRTPDRIKRFLETCELYYDGIPTPDYAKCGFSVEVKLRKDNKWARFNKFTYVRLSRNAFDELVRFLRDVLSDTGNIIGHDLSDLEKSKIYY